MRPCRHAMLKQRKVLPGSLELRPVLTAKSQKRAREAQLDAASMAWAAVIAEVLASHIFKLAQ